MRRILGLAGCVLLGSCGNQSTAGGGSDQPNSLEIAVVLADGTPAAGASARWVSGEWNLAETANVVADPVEGASARVGPDGNLVIEEAPEGVWHLEILDSASHQLAVVASPSGRVALQPAARWSGILSGSSTLPGTLALAGTSRRAVVAPDHSFQMDWLPPGSYRVLGAWGKEVRELATRRFSLGESLSKDTLNGDSSEVDLVDLDRYPLRSALRGQFWDDADTLSGRWLQMTDTSSRIEPSGWAQDPALARRESRGLAYLRWDFSLGSEPVGIDGKLLRPWAGVGLEVSPSGLSLDWREATSIRVRARGCGLFRFQVVSRLVDSLRGAPYGTVVSLDSTWRWIDIPVGSLWPDDGIVAKGGAWRDAAASIYALRLFALQSDSRLELADIRVRGRIAPRLP